jgi:hypothetical protein
MIMRTRAQAWLAIALLLLASAALFATAPRGGVFWWSDAPRHALNGVFLHDLVLAMPVHHLRRWAIDYYLQYPALTIMFYPPLLAVGEMLSYFVFGISQAAAVVPVALAHAALAVATFLLARRWLPLWQAWAAGLLLAGLPEVALWARQPMTDVPAMALLAWSALFLLRHLETARLGDLVVAVAFFMLGLYTKQSIIFLAPVAGLLLWQRHRTGLLRQWRIWALAGAAVLAVLPLVAMTVLFGQGNVQSVVAIQDSHVSRASLAGWLYYASLLPRQAGWCVTGLAASFIVGALVRRRWRLADPGGWLLFGWLVAAYLFFSAIDLKDGRLDLAILLPIALFAVLAINRLLPVPWADGAAILLAVLGLGYTLAFAPVPRVTGYREAAAWIAANTPPDAVVAFSGQRDGAFIFNLRTLDPERRHTVIRADKLLLGIAIRRELGVVEKIADPAAIIAALQRYGVSTVVAQRDFWIDLKPMAALQSALGSDAFARVGTIAVAADIPHTDTELGLYRSLLPLPAKRTPLTVDLPIIGQRFTGEGAQAKP